MVQTIIAREANGIKSAAAITDTLNNENQPLMKSMRDPKYLFSYT